MRIIEWVKFKCKWWPRLLWMIIQLIVIIISLVVMFPFLPYTPIPAAATDVLDRANALKDEYLEESERLGFN